jgi:hypothetical protein
MNYLSEKDMTTFFERNNNHYVNSVGMRIGFSEKSGVWTLLELASLEESEGSVSISTEEESLQEFIVDFKIETWRNIDQLDYNQSWIRYLDGDATITYTLPEFEADISFKIVKSKTIIFSMDLHFYDEMYEHLTIPEDFQRYISEHERRLRAAVDNRYRISKKQ